MKRLRSPLAVLPALGGLVASASVLFAAPANATSCVAPEATPQAIVAGDAEIFGSRFLDHFDFAVIGTVTAVVTDESPDGGAYGRTETTFDVAAVHGVDAVANPFVVTSSDPGWLNGWGFAVGSSYFVPVQVEGPNAMANYSFVCDPIFLLEPGDVDELIAVGAVAVAAEPVVEPVDEPVVEPPVVDPAVEPVVDPVVEPVVDLADDGGVSATAITVGLAVALAGAAGAGFVVFTRRRPPTAA